MSGRSWAARVLGRAAAVVAVLAAAVLAAPASAEAQIGGLPVPRIGGGGGGATRPQRPESLLVKWLPTDSAIDALVARKGYVVTRYQGDTVRFRAEDRVLTLTGKPAAVRRDQTLLVGRTIRYDDSTQIIVARGDSARGDTVVLRDPAQGEDVIVRGGITYDVAARRGVVSAFQTAVASGENWFVQAERGALISDSLVDGKRYVFARDGSITSCEDSVPHYHFQARDIKMVTRNLLVVRPAVLYIADVPVLWLPFVFQDMRSGRRSGILPPRFGVAELLRNNAGYQRAVENIGYYFNLGDYVDATVWGDWLSGSRPREGGNPGFLRANGEIRYRWIDRFIQGRLSTSYTAQRDGSRNAAVSIGHEQSFNRNRRLSANLNWVQNTTVQRQNAINPAAVLGTIASQLNFQDRFGPFAFSVGGTRRQYPGRSQVDQDFPNVNLTAQTIAIGSAIDWTPTLSITNSQSTRIDQGVPSDSLFFVNADGTLRTQAVRPATRNSSVRLESPLRIQLPFREYDLNLQNSFSFTEQVRDFPQFFPNVYRDVTDTTTREGRLFNQTFTSNFDWNPSFNLPRFSQGKWNLSPTLSLVNVEGGAGLVVRSERTGGRWVAQRKRVSAGLSSAPTFYAFPPGFWRVERFRHSINPVVSWSYSPRADVSNDFLAAIGRTRQGYLGSLVQNRVSLQLSTNLEAKLRRRGGAAGGAPGGPTPPGATDSAAAAGAPGARLADSTGVRSDAAAARDSAAAFRAEDPPLRTVAGGSAVATGGDKIRLLTLNFTPLNFDLARADSLGGSLFNRRGFVDRTFGFTARSDLLPGLDFRTNYELFAGDPQSDTAVFRPFRTDVNVSFSLDQNSALFATIARLFGRRLEQSGTTGAATPSQTRTSGAPGGDAFFSQQAVAQQVAGQGARNAAFNIPGGRGFQASVTYTAARQRPPLRGQYVVLDPAQICEPRRRVDPVGFEICVAQALASPPPAGAGGLPQTTFGGPIFASPPSQSVQLNTSFPITPKWAAQWTTTYDAQRGGFASQQVNLQRELHDWRAIFAFTQAPNGNFAFNFFIALKAQPDLKFDYNRQTFRQPPGTR